MGFTMMVRRIVFVVLLYEHRLIFPFFHFSSCTFVLLSTRCLLCFLVLVCLCVCVFCLHSQSTYAVLIYVQPYATTVGNVWIPLFIAMVISYVVVNLFMAVFARTLDTLLVCYVAEESMAHRHGGAYKRKQPGMADEIKQEVSNSKLKSKPSEPQFI